MYAYAVNLVELEKAYGFQTEVVRLWPLALGVVSLCEAAEKDGVQRTEPQPYRVETRSIVPHMHNITISADEHSKLYAPSDYLLRRVIICSAEPMQAQLCILLICTTQNAPSHQEGYHTVYLMGGNHLCE
jgi:hypothetical protein